MYTSMSLQADARKTNSWITEMICMHVLPGRKPKRLTDAGHLIWHRSTERTLRRNHCGGLEAEPAQLIDRHKPGLLRHAHQVEYLPSMRSFVQNPVGPTAEQPPERRNHHRRNVAPCLCRQPVRAMCFLKATPPRAIITTARGINAAIPSRTSLPWTSRRKASRSN